MSAAIGLFIVLIAMAALVAMWVAVVAARESQAALDALDEHFKEDHH